MQNKRFVDRVIDNKDKQNTYRELNMRRNESLTSKNYVEVVAYDYAMIEDRLLSILKHLDIIILCGTKYKIVKKIKKDFYKMYYNDSKDNHKSPSFSNISTKMKTLYQLIKYNGDSLFFKDRCNMIKQIDNELNIEEKIEKLGEWCNKRNEITHSLYNKNIKDLDKKIKDIALEGKDLSYSFSRICNEIKKIKNEYNSK